jgi:hypothetical protein
LLPALLVPTFQAEWPLASSGYPGRSLSVVPGPLCPGNLVIQTGEGAGATTSAGSVTTTAGFAADAPPLADASGAGTTATGTSAGATITALSGTHTCGPVVRSWSE